MSVTQMPSSLEANQFGRQLSPRRTLSIAQKTRGLNRAHKRGLNRTTQMDRVWIRFGGASVRVGLVSNRLNLAEIRSLYAHGASGAALIGEDVFFSREDGTCTHDIEQVRQLTADPRGGTSRERAFDVSILDLESPSWDDAEVQRVWLVLFGRYLRVPLTREGKLPLDEIGVFFELYSDTIRIQGGHKFRRDKQGFSVEDVRGIIGSCGESRETAVRVIGESIHAHCRCYDLPRQMKRRLDEVISDMAGA